MPASNSPARPSSPSSQIPPSGGGGGIYIGLAVLLLLAIGGVIYWKTKVAGEPAPVASVAPPPLRELPTTEPLPPPPPEEEDAAAPVDAAVKPTTTTAQNGCAVAKCTGVAGSALQAAVGSRAASARGCYERALRVNSMLEGKLVVSLHLDAAGAVCSASIAQDGVHSGEVSTCVLGMFRGARFPAPDKGCVDINVPLSFVPRNK